MAYVKIIYQNSPSTATPINAENLNHMDDQIALNDQRLTEIETSYVKSFNGRKGEVTPQANDYNMSQITPTNGATVGQIPIVRNDGTTEEPNLTFHMEDVPSSGHVIKDQSGTSLAQEDALQFSDSFLTDDSANGRTVVENVKEVASADYSSETEDGMYLIPDGEGAVIEPASDDKVEVTADGNTTRRDLFNWLFNHCDTSKIRENAYIVYSGNGRIYHYEDINNGTYIFAWESIRATTIEKVCLQLNSSTSTEIDWTLATTGNTKEENYSYKPANGYKYTLYYGNKKATVDLQTTANRCWMSDGVTSVEDELNYSGKKRTYYGIVITNNMFIVILPPNIVEKGSPTSIESHRIVEIAVGGRSYSSFSFNENGLVVTTTDTNMTMGHAIRFTATITW